MPAVDPHVRRIRKMMRAIAKVSGGSVILYQTRRMVIIEPPTGRRDVKTLTLGHVAGEAWLRRGSYFEIFRNPMTCERVPLPQTLETP